MIPSGWNTYKLGEFMEFKNGINTDKSQYGSGYKFVNVMDVFNNDFLVESNIIGRVNIDEKKLKDNSLNYGDILFNRTSEILGEIAMSAVYLDIKPAVFGGFVIRGRPQDNYLNPKFSIYLFQSAKFRNQVIKLGQGAVRSNIGQKDLSKVLINLPPLTEQTKIAEILTTWDKAIETTEKLLSNTEQQKKAVMQQLLTGKKRLKDEKGNVFCGEWNKYNLKQASYINKGKALSSKDIIKGDYDVIAGGKTSPYKHNNFTHKNIITVSASGAYAGYVWFHKEKIWASDCSVVENTKISSIEFLYYFLKLNQKKIYSLQSGGAQPHIYPKDLEVLKINLPPLKEQKAIATVLTNTDNQIAKIKEKLTALKQEKKALMQVLLSGKVRVK